MSSEAVQEFAKIWAEEVGETITYERAEFEARRLIELFWLLAQAYPGELRYNGSAESP